MSKEPSTKIVKFMAPLIKGSDPVKGPKRPYIYTNCMVLMSKKLST